MERTSFGPQNGQYRQLGQFYFLHHHVVHHQRFNSHQGNEFPIRGVSGLILTKADSGLLKTSEVLPPVFVFVESLRWRFN
jgi:hypothetical protein